MVREPVSSFVPQVMALAIREDVLIVVICHGNLKKKIPINILFK
jgi:hypothetical protein